MGVGGFLAACGIALAMGLWYWLEGQRDERPFEYPDPLGRGVVHRYVSDDLEVLFDHKGNFVEILTWPRKPLFEELVPQGGSDEDDWPHGRLM